MWVTVLAWIGGVALGLALFLGFVAWAAFRIFGEPQGKDGAGGK